MIGSGTWRRSKKEGSMRNDLIFIIAFIVLTAWAYVEGWTGLALCGAFLLGVSSTVLAARLGWTRSPVS
jgi:hypothetical protein